jgi:hypothetical protein
LKEYVGAYHSPEVDFTYTLTMEKHRLQLMSNQSTTSKNPMEYIAKDQFRIGNLFFRFRRNAKAQITGFELNTGRVKHLPFNRVEAKAGK